MKSEGQEFLDLLERLAEPTDLPALLMACSGKRVYVPPSSQQISERNWIVRAIGRDKAGRLLDALNRDTPWGLEISVPFAGGGLLNSVYRMISERVLAGFNAGRPVSVIAAECGITRRTVQTHRARLIARGLFPSPDASAVLSEQYSRPISSLEAAPVLRIVGEEPSSDADGNLSGAFHAATASVAALPEDGMPLSRGQYALQIIERVHGPDASRRIAAACKGKRVSLRPRAVMASGHPFRTVLDETESRLIALSIVSQIGGKARLVFGDVAPRPADDEKVSEIRSLLAQGMRPVLISYSLNVSIGIVRRYRDELENERFLQAQRDRAAALENGS